MEKKKLDEILKKHAAWLNDEDGGERADLSCAFLSGAYLRGAYLSCAYLRGADLSGADLYCADLSDTDLIDADLRGANLSCAYLSGAYLRGAYLSCAYLRGANLIDADLSDTDLRCADLSGTFLSGADLSGAAFDDHIVCLDRIGSEKRRTTYNATKDIVWCGCFRGTFEKWVAKIRATYPDENNVYRKEYEAAITYFKAIAKASEREV